MAQKTDTKKESKPAAPRARKRKGVDKWKNKKWFTIMAPSAFNNVVLGHTPSESPEGVQGRSIMVSARELTGNIKKTQLMLDFRVNNVQGLNAFTELHGIAFQSGSIRRMVRRKSTKIESVDKVMSKDGKIMRVKSVALSTINLSRPQQTAVRKLLQEDVRAMAGEHNYDAFLTTLVTGEYGSTALAQIRKIAPMKRVDILRVTPLSK